MVGIIPAFGNWRKAVMRHSCLLVFFVLPGFLIAWTPRDDKTKCPKVKALRNLDLDQMIGFWYIVEYYASSEEAPQYSCMRAHLSMTTDRPGVFMNFSYSFADDPDRDLLNGNITWIFPQPTLLAHWVHAEDTYEGVYNTYVLDLDKSFALLLHCAEMPGSTRYLSSLVLSRTILLPNNVITYLREKLPKYDIDLAYMFPMGQVDCPQQSTQGKTKKMRKNLLKPRRRNAAVIQKLPVGP